MSRTSCPHYIDPSVTTPVATCRGCNAQVANPNSQQAVAEGKIRTDGGPKMVAYPASTAR